MSARFVNIDRDTPLLFPEDLRKWVPENHIVHFIIDAVMKLDIRNFKVTENGSGDEQYPPEMMLALLIYCYVTKRMSSRAIEAATYMDIGARYICGNKAHPDHSVLCRFRTGNREAFGEAFTKILMMALELGVLKRIGGVSVDGTKVHANASKHSAVYTPDVVCADAGFFCEEEIVAVEARDEQGKRGGPEVYCAVEKQSHHKSVRDIEKQEEPEPPGPGATVKEVMAHKLKTKKGKETYRRRKQTVEPVFGIIKAAMGFRQFLLRGLEKASLEWELVTLAYDFKRLYGLKTG